MIAIAIDGPSGAGKSSISRIIANNLRFIYVDTGAMYRAIALYVVENGIDPSDSKKVAGCLADIDIRLEYKEDKQSIILNGRDVSDYIRTPLISMAASDVSAIAEVREFLLDLQRSIAQKSNCIMDGRDIGTVVIPDAAVKIFLTASAEDRAMRRYRELVQMGKDVTYESVLSDVIKRDYNDSNRAIAPLKPADDAIILDTTGDDLETATRKTTRVILDRLEELGISVEGDRG